MIKVSPRARRMRLSVDPRTRSVLLTVPKRTSRRRALAWAAGHRAWIEQALADIPDPLPFAPGGTVPLEGPSLAPGWIGTVAKFNPVDWAAVAARYATTESFDWGLSRAASGCWRRSLVLSAWFATRAFGVYQRSL